MIMVKYRGKFIIALKLRLETIQLIVSILFGSQSDFLFLIWSLVINMKKVRGLRFGKGWIHFHTICAQYGFIFIQCMHNIYIATV